MRRLQQLSRLALAVAAIAMVAEQASGAILRYRASGDWTQITDGTTPGWGPNPVGVGSTLPGASDDARINFGGNTVTVMSAVPAVSRVQIGVDESGTLEVNSGGVLTANLDVLAGNNNSNATGTLVVNDGGIVNVNRILWAASDNSSGVINVNEGGLVTVASHLWWGVTGTATANIGGTVQQTGGILGLGTSDAISPSGGSATVNILDNGLLALNNIAPVTSIQNGSSISIFGSGELTVPGDVVGTLDAYAAAGKLLGNGVVGSPQLVIDLTRNPGFTTAYLIPEPSALALLGIAAPLFARRRD